jgi:hypothetical protein
MFTFFIATNNIFSLETLELAFRLFFDSFFF